MGVKKFLLGVLNLKLCKERCDFFSVFSESWKGDTAKDDEVAKNSDVSGDTIRRCIRLTELSTELQQMVDEKKIALARVLPCIACRFPALVRNPAVYLLHVSILTNPVIHRIITMCYV